MWRLWVSGICFFGFGIAELCDVSFFFFFLLGIRIWVLLRQINWLVSENCFVITRWVAAFCSTVFFRSSDVKDIRRWILLDFYPSSSSSSLRIASHRSCAIHVLFLFAVFVWNLIRLLGFLLLSCARAAARLVVAEELGEKRRSQGPAGKRLRYQAGQQLGSSL